MPRFGPISRTDLIRALKNAGWNGPFSGGKHPFMLQGEERLTVPNPHRGDIGRDLLARILAQAGISREEWEKL